MVQMTNKNHKIRTVQDKVTEKKSHQLFKFCLTQTDKQPLASSTNLESIFGMWEEVGEAEEAHGEHRKASRLWPGTFLLWNDS